MKAKTALRTAAYLTATLCASVVISCGGSGGDQPGTAPPVDTTAAGKELFRSAGCAGCHTLAAADASGPVGPVLDGLGLEPARVEQMIRDGGGQMPSFAEKLKPTEIETLAQFVSQASS